MPVFMAAVMAAVQASLWFLARSAALAAARQGADAARYLGAPRDAGPRAAVSFARSAAAGYLLSPRASAAGSTATTIQMTVTGRAPSLVPGVVIRIRETVQAPVERFTAQRAGLVIGHAVPVVVRTVWPRAGTDG